MNQHGERLSRAVSMAYEANRFSRSVSPAYLATQAMKAIGFPPALHNDGYYGCHLQLRQIAREICREKADPVARAGSDVADLFPDTLQERYPARPRHGEEPEYILLDHLVDDDIDFNVDRMRRASLALQRHSDALEVFKHNRKQAAD